jgi:hypothetical protein
VLGITTESIAIARTSFFCADLFRIQGYDRVKTPWSSILVWTFAAIMVLIAIWSIAVLFANWYKKPTYSAKKLFQALARKHRLSSQEVTIISQIAKKLPPSVPPAVLFIEPSYWESANTVPDGNAQQLASKIFGSAYQPQSY